MNVLSFLLKPLVRNHGMNLGILKMLKRLNDVVLTPGFRGAVLRNDEK